MTGDEHYKRAEELIEGYKGVMKFAEKMLEDPKKVNWVIEAMPTLNSIMVAAQVHATLALAAATMDAAFVTINNPDDAYTLPTLFVDEDRRGWGYGV